MDGGESTQQLVIDNQRVCLGRKGGEGRGGGQRRKYFADEYHRCEDKERTECWMGYRKCARFPGISLRLRWVNYIDG